MENQNFNEPYICKDGDGNVFISLDEINERELSEKEQFTHCLAVVKIGNDYLLGWNRWRSRYEIFGGCIDVGESARECILRECREELGLQEPDIVYLGAMKFLLAPDYFSPDERIEYGGLYGIQLHGVNIADIQNQINDRDEILKLAMYSEIKNKEPISVLDEKMLEFFR